MISRYPARPAPRHPLPRDIWRTYKNCSTLPPRTPTSIRLKLSTWRPKAFRRTVDIHQPEYCWSLFSISFASNIMPIQVPKTVISAPHAV